MLGIETRISQIFEIEPFLIDFTLPFLVINRKEENYEYKKDKL